MHPKYLIQVEIIRYAHNNKDIYDTTRNMINSDEIILLQKIKTCHKIFFATKIFPFFECCLILVAKSFCDKKNVSHLIIYRDIIYLLSPITYFNENVPR